MKRIIALNHHMDGYNDIMFSLSIKYGIQYAQIEEENGNVMLFSIKEELEDTRTVNYFRDLLCYIFNTEPSNYFYTSSTAYEVSIYTILLAFVDSVRNNYNDRHYKEAIKRFHDSRKIETIDSMPVIHQLKNGKFMLTPTEYYQVGYDTRERIAPEKLKGNTQQQSGNRDKNKRAVYRNFNWNNLYESCHLYRSFCDGEEFYDAEQIFLIARNLCGAEKGKQHFLDIIKDREAEGYYHWKEILTAIIKGNIPLAPCEECEYCDCCQHSENMLLTAKPQRTEIRQTQKERYVSIEEVTKELNQAFQKTIDSYDKSIYIIKAQTGIGKTQTYLNYMKKADKSLLIAVPTHDLKKEILQKAINMGIQNICCTPDLEDYVLSDDLKREIDNLYTVGAGEYVLKYLTGQLQKLKHDDSDYVNILAYLNALKSAYRSKGHIITTHARLMHMKQEILDTHEIIVDEDILRTAINANSVNMEELKIVRNSGIFNGAVQSRLNYLCMNRGYHKLDKLYFEKDDELMKKISGLQSNICDLLNSEYVYITSKMIHYLTDNPLPQSQLIILSATASPKLYQEFYSERRIDFYECQKAQYKGRIIQHTDCSYSGYVLEKNPDRISSLYSSAKCDEIITFKNIEQEFNTKYHFGNVEGLNSLSGKNLSVIGLPNKPDFVYCLYGMRAGLELTQTQNMHHQRIEWNGYSFSLNTFKDKTLQDVQIWMLSSQLEQAVGRARLLRNDCTVTVYAGFPVEQAEFRR
ncbi:MAG: DEAD/DEAH box helicase family protein [Oscillospiraceae bacterium]|nr:DEAD/DEAH box helicase family protein [Oscillospiraceae bacterium]